MSPAPVTLQLSNDEALVLFEFLGRVSSTEALRIEDPAEERVLWTLEAQLDKVLVEPFNAGYGRAVAAARKRLRDQM